jgi:hypothetical protein
MVSGGGNVRNKNRVDIVCEAINKIYLEVHMGTYIYIIFCV